MLAKIVRISLKYGFLIIIAYIVIAVIGIRAYQSLPIDAFPDITPTQVVIFTESEGLAPEEIEKLITIPIESVMLSLPKVEKIRSISIFGLSTVTVFFEDGTDVYFARSRVLEKLPEAEDRIPEGYGTPVMGPNTTGLGMVYQYYLEDATNKASLMDLRTLQDWTVKTILRTAPGVDDILSFGGPEKQYQVLIDPQKLVKYGLTLSDVFSRIASNNKSVGGQYIVRNQESYPVRGLGLVSDVSSIGDIVLSTEKGIPTYLRDVARIVEAPGLRIGEAVLNGKEVTTGIALKRTGTNAKTVIDAVKEKITVAKNSITEHVNIKTIYDRSSLTEKAIGTVKNALFEGAVLVMIVLFLFLGEVRSSIVVVLALPFSTLIAFILMNQFGVTANLMSLGGLAVGIGMMVDGAVVMVENGFRLLSEKKDKPHGQVILEAALEVAQPIAFAVIIIITVFLPIFSLQSIEGKMFHPMALTIIFAMLGSLLITMTLIPVTSVILLRSKKEEESRLVRAVKRAYLPILQFCLHRGMWVIGSAVALFVISLFVFQFVGKEFIPTLEEGSIQIRMTAMPSTSIDEAIEITKKAEDIVLQFPEVNLALGLVGRAEQGEPEAVSNIETYVDLKPFSQWRNGMTKQQLVDEMRSRLDNELPYVLFSFSQPIQLRVDELISGIKASLAIKIYGEDLKTLEKLAEKVKGALASVRGVRDLQTVSMTGSPELKIEVNRDAISRYGINTEDVLNVVKAGIGGEPVSTLIDGVKRFNILIWFDEAYRKDIDSIREIPIRTPDGNLIPLSRVANISFSSGTSQINRENFSRFAVVQCNVEGRDIGGFVAEAQRTIEKEIKFPSGYYTVWGGQFENQQRALKRLYIVVPITILLIYILLYTAFGYLKYAALIILNVPFSVIGGIWSLLLSGQNFSVPAAIGFIAVFGVAMLNGVVLVSFINKLREEGLQLHEAVVKGTELRLRPVLITASVTILGLLPLLFARGIGSEVQRPLATVVVGGLFTSTILTLLVIPVVYKMMEQMNHNEPIIRNEINGNSMK